MHFNGSHCTATCPPSAVSRISICGMGLFWSICHLQEAGNVGSHFHVPPTTRAIHLEDCVSTNVESFSVSVRAPQWQRDESTAKPRESLLRIWNFDGLLKGDNQEERTRARLPAGELSHLPDVRYDGINHTLGTVTQGRCGVCQRNTKNETQQQKCSVRLHTEMGEQASKSII
ncbi:hypothetical protein T4B_2195 [Trichinella pseudospiralis]|uniref:Uncharacterized protein n=1 Tax=Trichinella pseudospiralis TaxID=6337 RepID=A0A0V1JNN7_TRIPS|nr:hypothetical protein T4B_2195 [Trichinella pseudospiralis]KRZ36197.1 hypothetical protein T4C_3716 [Trichinella pseudospiralis]